MTFQKQFLLLILASIALCHAGHGRSFCSGPIVDLTSGRAESVTITRWGNASQRTTIVTFSFIRSAYMEYAAAEGASGVQVEPILNVNGVSLFPFPTNSHELVTTAFQLWAAVANISFVEVDGLTEEGMIRIGTHALSLAGGELGHAYFPGISAVAGDIHFAKNYPWTASEFFATAVHEIGHSIGLRHIVGAGDVADVVMNPFIPNVVSALTPWDIAYTQRVYGLPMPRLGVTGVVDATDTISWFYPCDNGTDGLNEFCTLQPTGKYAADFTENADKTIVIANIQRHALTSFDLQTPILRNATVFDLAEGAGSSILDPSFDDVGDPVIAGWSRTATNVLAGVQSYHVDHNLVADQPSTFRLFQQPFLVAGGSSRLRFLRASVLRDAESFVVRATTDQGLTFRSLLTEVGSADSVAARRPAATIDLDLSWAAGQIVLVDFAYVYRGTHWDVADGGVTIDNIEWMNVLVPSPSSTPVSTVIGANARSIKLAELADDDYLLGMRAKFVDASTSNFGIGYKQVENQAAAVTNVFASVTGILQAGAMIDVNVVFDEIVTVSGSPRLELRVGNGIRNALFTTGSGTQQLTFRYVVAESDEECRLQYLNHASLQRNGGDIVDFFDAPANLDLPRPGTAGALDTKPAITLENAGPTVETALVAGNNEYVEIRFSEGVYGNSAATIPVGLDDFAAFLGQEPLILEALVDVNDSVLHGGESTLRLRFSAPPIQTPAQIITIRLVADIFDCAGHALTANPDQPLAMIVLNQTVAFTLRWIADDNTPEETLVVGRDPAGVDVTAPPSAHLYSLGENALALAVDYSALEEFSYWTIVAQAPGDMDTATLCWEIAQARPDYRLFLQEWDESRPIGAPIDLRIIDSIVVQRTTTYQLMYGPAQTMEIPPLQPGWNLICIPLHYQEAVESVFGGRVSSTMWAWRGDRFLAADTDHPTNPGDGYWLFSASGCPPLTVSGLPGVQIAPIESGWNLIGHTSAAPLPESIVIWQWDEINQQLERVNGAYSSTRGYWWFAR